MTEKRFKLGYVCGDFGLIDNDEWIDLHSMSENSEKNVQICINKMNELAEENEQLKQDNEHLIHLLENQSIIIQELHSKLMHYELKEPIVLTKEDLELMGKAISYYSHGRYVE